jgi:hypothetical protein
LVKRKFKKIALRVSYYEDISIAQKLKGKVNWIWFDTFKGLPKDLNELKYLKNKLKYKINALIVPGSWDINLPKKMMKIISFFIKLFEPTKE